jgi:purine-nucleoside phosphorylase
MAPIDDAAVLKVLRRAGFEGPDLLVTLGSGQTDPWRDQRVASLRYEEVPGWTQSGVAGHIGRLGMVRRAEGSVLVMEGRHHYYESRSWEGVLAPLRAAVALGARIALLTNSAGGLLPDLVPGTLVVTTGSVMTQGPPDLAGVLGRLPRPCPGRLWWGPGRRVVRDVAGRTGVPVRSGVIWYTPGPTYETRAEAGMARRLGASVAAMSLAPEALMAAALGLRVIGLSLVTNQVGGGRIPDHEEVLSAAGRFQPLLDELLREVVGPLCGALETEGEEA